MTTLKNKINEYERYGDICEVNVMKINEEVKKAVLDFESFLSLKN